MDTLTPKNFNHARNVTIKGATAMIKFPVRGNTARIVLKRLINTAVGVSANTAPVSIVSLP